FLNNSDAYYTEDMMEIFANDWPVKRFLMVHNMDVAKSTQEMCQYYRMRKQKAVRDRNAADFPSEFYSSGGSFIIPKSVTNGRPVLVTKPAKFRKLPIEKYRQLVEQFLVHMVYKVDEEAGEEGWIAIWDFTGVLIENVDRTIARL